MDRQVGTEKVQVLSRTGDCERGELRIARRLSGMWDWGGGGMALRAYELSGAGDLGGSGTERN